MLPLMMLRKFAAIITLDMLAAQIMRRRTRVLRVR